MNTNKMHILFLTFKDEKLENEFIANNDFSNRIFNRLGLYLAISTWLFILILYYYMFDEKSYSAIKVIMFLLIPGLIINIVITHFRGLLRLYQPFTAFSNFIGAIYVNYIANMVIKNVVFYSAMIIGFLFICFFIFRIRFKIASVVTLFYVLLSQIALLYFCVYSKAEIIMISSAFWVVYFIAIFAGYFFELATRDNFLQGKVIQMQNEQILKEQEKSDSLLKNILPEQIAEQLKLHPGTIANEFKNCTILFADIVGFTLLSGKVSPNKLVDILNQIFSRFDDIADKYKIEKIKTIGDAYMAVAGLPEARDDHAEAIAQFAIDINRIIKRFKFANGLSLNLRIGINSGSVIAGVIGKRKFIYDIWGDSVNTASRMESHGIPGKIHVSVSTYNLIKDSFFLEKRGEITIKGKGNMNTYFLLSKS
ncbi:MAG: adenylate/guanylate cyclase domain-containing protein [Spirochaetes bacterium]|nr:adenylate/guanylate cyclase domain-containing protein [Spirochaetota bacterium]